MDFEKLMLSKPSSPGSSSYISNLAAVKDAGHDYGFAELAEVLGLNYDATKQVMYAGENSSYGFHLGIKSSRIEVQLFVKDTIIEGSTFIIGSSYTSLTTDVSRMLYKKGDNGVVFGFSSRSEDIVPYIVTTCITKDNDVKNCYFFNGCDSNSNTAFAFYSEENSSSDTNAIRCINTTSVSLLDNRSTDLISLCPLLNSFEGIYTNNIYLSMIYPSGKPTTAHIININNKEYIVLARYSSNNTPAIFETGNIITSS